MAIQKNSSPLLITLERVWDFADHNAFTDLILYNGKFLLVFRESTGHDRAENGVIRLLESVDGHQWEPRALIEEEGVDLRDPKLSVMPNGNLHLLMGGNKLDREGEIVYTSTRVTTAGSDLHFGPIKKVGEINQWIWRLTWYQGFGYGMSYNNPDEEEERYVSLYKTDDGFTFEKVRDFEIDRWPSESTIRFDESGKMHVMVRRDESWKTHALLGISSPPYLEWEWYDTGYSIGAPNFLIGNQGELWVSGRLIYFSPYLYYAKTVLLLKVKNQFHRKLLLPSYNDTSYTGMVMKDGFLWMSYYSTHEEKTSVYIAKILLP